MTNKYTFKRPKLGLIAISSLLVMLFQNCGGQFRTLDVNNESSASSSIAPFSPSITDSTMDASTSGAAASDSKHNVIGSANNSNASKELTALPFESVENARINNAAPYENYTQTNKTYSNTITLQGLPAGGTVINITELLNSKPGECIFAFKINDGNFSCYMKKNSVVKNGDRLQFFALNSGYFADKLSMAYKIGDIYQGIWSVTTMADPGTNGSFSPFFVNTSGKIGETIYSEVLTVGNLGDNVRVPLRWTGHSYMEVAINGTWYSYTKSMSPEGNFLKNGDKVQVRFASAVRGQFRLELLLDSVGKVKKTMSRETWSVSVE